MTLDLRPRLLIVEDDPDIRKLLGRLLGDQGYRVCTAACGLEAADRLRPGEDPPDVVLVDLQIPEPSGHEIIRLIRDMGLTSRRTGRPVRVVAYTGHDDDAPAVRLAMEAGADAVLAKPCELDHVLAVLRDEEPSDVTMIAPAPTEEAAP